MTWLHTLIRWLSGGATKRHDGLVRDTLKQRRSQAQQAYEDAVRRGDTRDQHITWKALFDATNGELSA